MSNQIDIMNRLGMRVGSQKKVKPHIKIKKKFLRNKKNKLSREYVRRYMRYYYNNKIGCDIEKVMGGNTISVLEIGCGHGGEYESFEINHILDLIDYHGIDESIFIDSCKEKFPDGKFEVMCMDDLSFDDNSFDVVLMSGGYNIQYAYAIGLNEAIRVCSGAILIINSLPKLRAMLGKHEKYLNNISKIKKVVIVPNHKKINLQLGIITVV